MRAKGIAGAVLVAASWLAAGEDIERMTRDEFYGGEAAVGGDAGRPGLLRPLGVALVLIGGAGGLLVVWKRLGARRPLRGGRALTVLETACLSQKHTVALVRVRNRVLLLGLGQDVRTLATFDGPDDVLGFDGEFRRELDRALGEEEKEDAISPYRRQVARLRDAVGRWRTRLKGEVSP